MQSGAENGLNWDQSSQNVPVLHYQRFQGHVWTKKGLKMDPKRAKYALLLKTYLQGSSNTFGRKNIYAPPFGQKITVFGPTLSLFSRGPPKGPKPGTWGG